MNVCLNFLKKIYRERRAIRALAHRDISSRHSDTFLRSAWEFINPVLTMLVFWFVFSVALNTKGSTETPFIVYFVTGQVPWLFFSETLMRGTQGVITHSFLVKKTLFFSELLPFVYLASCTMNHVMLLVVVMIILLLNGVGISWYWLQIIYYFFTLYCFLIGLQWLFSALNVFNRDIGQILGVFLNLLFWMTPIVWMPDSISLAGYGWIIKLNPLAYIIDGYRGSLLYQQPIWIDMARGLYVWFIIICLLFLGGNVFRKLKPHFGDVL